MPTPAPAPAESQDLGKEFALLRQGIEFQHSTLVDGQRRIEDKVTAFRGEVARNYVDKVQHERLDARVKASEDRIVYVDGRVTTLYGYNSWAVKSVLLLIFAAIATILFKGGMHP